jgi:hypothetical protein
MGVYPIGISTKTALISGMVANAQPGPSYNLSDKKVKPDEGRCYLGAWLGIAPVQDQNPLIYAAKDLCEFVGGPSNGDECSFRLPYTSNFLLPSLSMKQYRGVEQDFSAMIGKRPKIIMTFEQWSNGFEYNPFPDTFCHEADSKGQIPLITWEPGGLPSYTDGRAYLDMFNDQMEAGIKDDNYKGEIYQYAKKWADAAKKYEKPFFVRPFHEMNLRKGPYPWEGDGNGGPERFIRAWKNLYQLFKNEGADNATFVWCPNEDSTANADDVASYFPGTDYVDWLGVDGYKKSIGDDFERIFGKTMRLFQTYGKPMMICETASKPNGDLSDTGRSTPVTKEEFIAQLFDAARTYHLSGIVYFNEDKSGKSDEFNWRIDADVEDKKSPPSPAETAFREAVKNDFIDGEPLNLPTGSMPTKMDELVIKSKRQVFVENEIKTIRAWLKNPFRPPYPGKDLSGVWIKLAEYEVELAGYVHKHDKKSSQNEVNLHMQNAINALSNVQHNKVREKDRDYLRALSKKKDIYKTWISLNADKNNEFNETVMRLFKKAGDTHYTEQFHNPVYKYTFGVYDFLDPTLYKKKELLGYQVSLDAAIGDVYSLGNTAQQDTARMFYKLADDLMNADSIMNGKNKIDNIANKEEFKRPRLAIQLGDFSARILDERIPESWWSPKLWGALIIADLPDFPVLRSIPAPFMKQPLFKYLKDEEKDVKADIAMGRAKIVCEKADLETLDNTGLPKGLPDLDKGVGELEEIAYNWVGVSKKMRLEAKLILVKELGRYRIVAATAGDSNIDIFNFYKFKADRRYVIARELAATEFAGRVEDLLSKK